MDEFGALRMTLAWCEQVIRDIENDTHRVSQLLEQLRAGADIREVFEQWMLRVLEENSIRVRDGNRVAEVYRKLLEERGVVGP